MNTVIKAVLATSSVFVIAACTVTNTQTSSNNTSPSKASQEISMTSNTEKVVQLLESFNTGDSAPIAYINPQKYIQHNLGVADGLAGFAPL